MPKEIIISVSGDQSRIAIVENDDLVELYVENPENVRTIGDIYLGRIRRILPGIKAAFVDVGQKQDAFLHFSDLSDEIPALLELAEGRIKERPAEELAREPADADDLEAESAEEQLAAKRRRELKRQPSSRGRRGKQGDTKEGAAEASDQAEKPAREEKRPERRSRRGPSANQGAPASVPAAPAILPPAAAEQQALITGAEASPAPAEAAESQGSEQQDERPRPRRRRGRRGRKASPSAAESTAEASVSEPQKPAEGKKRRSTTSKSGSPAARQTSPSASEGESGTPGKANLSISEVPVKTPGSTREDAPETPAAAPVLKRSSRYLIDLSGPSGGAPAPRREEEEEEEERTGRSRRKSRSGSGQGRGRSSKRGATNGKPADDQSGGRGSSNGRPPYDYLKQDQRILVKIIKEPISSKGSRVSTDVSLAGRFLVLVPAADYVAVSKKIESAKERRRLRALARSLLPEGLGLIVRTVAEGRDAKSLDMDLQLLLEKWRKIEDQLRERPDPPVKLYEDVNMVSSIVRDLFSDDYEKIVVDDSKVYRSLRNYIQAVAPQMADAVRLHQRKEPVFRTYKIEQDIRAAFEMRVSLPGGGYLFIEHTEAMHVIDVNSGRAGRGLRQEENALKVNLEAAREIAKQLRLRDLGGIICVDFIDMRSDGYRRKLFDEMKREFRRDRAVTKMLPMSDFGVMEITRQRLRPSITTTLDVEDMGEIPTEDVEDVEDAPEPARRAVARSATDVVEHLERWLITYRDEVLDRHRKRPIVVRAHPFLAAYLQRGIPSLLTRWRFKSRLKLKLDVDESVDPLSFSVRDEKSGKNLTRKYDPDGRSG